MVNVTHNADYRRSGNHIFLILFILTQQFLDYIDFLLFLAENIILHSDLFCLLVVDLLV